MSIMRLAPAAPRRPVVGVGSSRVLVFIRTVLPHAKRMRLTHVNCPFAGGSTLMIGDAIAGVTARSSSSHRSVAPSPRGSAMKIQFLGAVGTVTGSKYLVTTKRG